MPEGGKYLSYHTPVTWDTRPRWDISFFNRPINCRTGVTFKDLLVMHAVSNIMTTQYHGVGSAP